VLQEKLEQASREASRKRLLRLLILIPMALVVGLGLLAANQYYEIWELRRNQSHVDMEIKSSPEPVGPAKIMGTPPEVSSPSNEEKLSGERETPEPDQQTGSELRPGDVRLPMLKSRGGVKQAEPAPPSGASNAADREAFKEALRAFELEPEPQIRAQNFAAWRPEKQQDILFLKEAAVSAFATGNYAIALAELEKASQMARQEVQALDAAFDQAYALAQKSKDADDYESAKGQIDEALRLKPSADKARALADEISSLPNVLELLRAAAIARAENNPIAEHQNLVDVLKLNPDRPGISERVSLLAKEIKERAYARHIQTGLAEVDARNLKLAEKQLSEARKIYAKREETDLLAARVADLKSNLETERLLDMAKAATASDNWRLGQELYDKAKHIQPRNQFAVEGYGLAQSIVSLNDQITQQLNAPDRLASDNIATEARRLVAKSGALLNTSPSLDKKSKALSDLLVSYSISVPVKVTSDGQTQISVRGVGKVGATLEKIIELKPGTYTFEGKRSGYKSKLLRVQIRPGNTQVMVSIVCDERI